MPSHQLNDETIRNRSVVPVNDPLVGQIVDNYKIESLLGTGAMGIVYRGVHQLIGKAAAIKVLKTDFADDPEMVQRLVREARAVNAIRHPSIVDIFGFGTLPRTEQAYIVMDLLEGVSLDDYLKTRAPMSLRDAVPFLDELLSALSAAHAVGVIHRDLKPSNIFVESKPDGQKGIKVIDFGLAKQADRAGGSVKPTNPGSLLGTPAFMAPEQVLGTKLTPSTDLYAVGGIAYQMLTNHLPHEATSAIEVLSLKLAQSAKPLRDWQPNLDAEVEDWVMNLLSRKPQHRFQDAEQARKALRRLHSFPQRTWTDVKTSLDREPVGVSKNKEIETTLPPSPGFQSRRARELPTVISHPDEVIKAQNPTIKSVPSKEAFESTMVPIPSKTPLYIALLSAVVVLLSALLWLVSQK